MDEIVSTIVANGLWAVLFCGLLVYELRDSRRRESRYTQVISALTDRLETVNEVKADTSALLTATDAVKADTEEIRSALKKRNGGKKDAPAPATSTTVAAT